MRYRIEYANGRCCNFANSRNLIDWLKLLKDETISDIRKIYKNGVADAVWAKVAHIASFSAISSIFLQGFLPIKRIYR